MRIADRCTNRPPVFSHAKTEGLLHQPFAVNLPDAKPMIFLRTSVPNFYHSFRNNRSVPFSVHVAEVQTLFTADAANAEAEQRRSSGRMKAY